MSSLISLNTDPTLAVSESNYPLPLLLLVPVVYNNQQLFFKARLLQLGSYTHKIQVNVYGTEVFFEVDEERNYRAYIDPTNTEAIDKVDKKLLQQIAEAIEYVRQ